jgi:beta-fructofuranosidase
MPLEGINGVSCEIELVVKVLPDGKVGFRVRASKIHDEYADLLYDRAQGKLIADTRKCGKDSYPNLEEAPFKPEKDEILTMRVFIDKSVVEVFINNRQAIGRRANPEHGGDGVFFIKEGGVEVLSLTVWEMQPSNPY